MSSRLRSSFQGWIDPDGEGNLAYVFVWTFAVHWIEISHTRSGAATVKQRFYLVLYKHK
jgi:hypothetical protein